MKKICSWMIIFIFLIVLSAPIDAKANSYNEEAVFDYADLLTMEEEENLRAYAKRYEKYGLSVVYVTIDDALGKSSMVYADEFYDDNHFRQDGVLFMIDMDNREVYICTTGKCIDILTDEKLDRILDENYTYAGDGEYYQCLKEVGSDTFLILESNLNIFFGAHLTAMYAVLFVLVITGIVLIVLLIMHRKTNRQPSAAQYMGANFRVVNRDNTYMGCRDEVLHGYYRQDDNHSISGGSLRMSSGGGSSRHVSSRGISHGGRGRKF